MHNGCNNTLTGRELVVLHHVRSNTGPCAAKASFAVHCNGSLRVLARLNELFQNVLRRSGAIHVVQVQVVDAGVGETLLVVVLLVEADDKRHTLLLEVWDVVVRAKSVVPLCSHLTGLVWASKRQESAIVQPVQVTVLHLLKVLVLIDVKLVEAEELALKGLPHASKTIQDRQVVCTHERRRVVEVGERRLRPLEGAKRLR